MTYFRVVAIVVSALFLSLPCAYGAARGDRLPSISLEDIDSQGVVDLAGCANGTVNALVFMQTSCGVCKMELKALKALMARKPQLNVIAVSIDGGSPGRIAGYKKANDFNFRFLHDPDFTAGQLFGFKFTPGLVVADATGSIVLIKSGFKEGDEAELEKTIDELTR